MSSPRSEKSAKALRYGFTTGACAAAATKGAALMLRDQQRIAQVDLPLPAGFSHRFTLLGQHWDERSAHCFVVKDAGDDPDVTHGVEVHAEVVWTTQESLPGQVHIQGGVGIGKVTKPGLAVAVGEWAINPVPRQMLLEAVHSVFPELPKGQDLQVTLSIPDGEQRARKTLNERLGILGGLSILGTTGVVKPISHKAWTDTLEVALDVALAAGCDTVVMSSGRTSELAAQKALELPEEALVMMGDHVGYALRACHRKGVPRVLLAVQFAKLLKIACGHEQTHVSSSRLDLSQLSRWGSELGLDRAALKTLECANTAREILESPATPAALIERVAAAALRHGRRLAPGSRIEILLVDYHGRTRTFA